jgi:hypothetical protein
MRKPSGVTPGRLFSWVYPSFPPSTTVNPGRRSGGVSVERDRYRLTGWPNEIGARALGRHLGRVLEMAESSADKWEYEAKIARCSGFAQQLELPMPIVEKQEAAN